MKCLTRRLAVVEAALERQKPPGAQFLDEACTTAGETLGRLESLVSEQDLENVCALLVDNLHLLSFLARIGCGQVDDSAQAALRWPPVLEEFLARTPADLRSAAVKAIGERDHPVKRWLDNLARQHSHLPAGASADVMRRLLVCCIEERDKIGDYSITCDRCRLERPFYDYRRLDLPTDPLGGCPACGTSAWTWTHLVPCGPPPESEGEHADGTGHGLLRRNRPALGAVYR